MEQGPPTVISKSFEKERRMKFYHDGTVFARAMQKLKNRAVWHPDGAILDGRKVDKQAVIYAADPAWRIVDEIVETWDHWGLDGKKAAFK